MGLRQQEEVEAPQPQSPPPTESQFSSTPSASTLPPEALALATKLFNLARTGSTPELDAYTTAGIPLNLTNHAGDTLIMLAAYHGHASTCQMLVSKGVDVNVLNDRGQSPIAGAVFKGYDDVVKVLVDGGADLSVGQPNAVEAAIMFKREECLRLFGVDGEGVSVGLGVGHAE
ncbi:related to ankyrin [Ramularia collo-cygni]|uniref:Related to ankyrin n=1 Tax=Ramularia collo-cygni TaxID=112498 RepID=A0A2D3V5D8_9PEZI|nr:related to ankyrin [Ramularia collo-cygni]CZT21905.1 related to ankyrin [Ramularia collo-cygni]